MDKTFVTKTTGLHQTVSPLQILSLRLHSHRQSVVRESASDWNSVCTCLGPFAVKTTNRICPIFTMSAKEAKIPNFNFKFQINSESQSSICNYHHSLVLWQAYGWNFCCNLALQKTTGLHQTLLPLQIFSLRLHSHWQSVVCESASDCNSGCTCLGPFAVKTTNRICPIFTMSAQEAQTRIVACTIKIFWWS